MHIFHLNLFKSLAAIDCITGLKINGVHYVFCVKCMSMNGTVPMFYDKSKK